MPLAYPFMTRTGLDSNRAGAPRSALRFRAVSRWSPGDDAGWNGRVSRSHHDGARASPSVTHKSPLRIDSGTSTTRPAAETDVVAARGVPAQAIGPGSIPLNGTTRDWFTTRSSRDELPEESTIRIDRFRARVVTESADS